MLGKKNIKYREQACKVIKNNKVPSQDRVKCKECGKYFKMITWTHLQNHGMTVNEYKEKYNLKRVKSAELVYRSAKIAIEKERFPVWPPEKVLSTIMKLHESKEDLSSNYVQRHYNSLYKAARYQYGSWKKTLEKLGLNYNDIRRDNTFTPEKILKILQEMYQNGTLLTAECMRMSDDKNLRHVYNSACFRFGGLSNALKEIGIDYEAFKKEKEEPPEYLSWTKEEILKRLLKYYEIGKCKNRPLDLKRAIEKEFGSWDAALKAGNIRPGYVRPRKPIVWTKERVIAEIKRYQQEDISLIGVSSTNYPFYKAMYYYFGGVSKALETVGIDYNIEAKKYPRGYNTEKVIAELREMHKQETLLLAGEMKKRHKKLYNACATYFGSYKNSIIAAGIDYKAFRRKLLN